MAAGWSYYFFQGWWHSLTHIHVLDWKGPHTLVRMGNPAEYGWLGYGGPRVSAARLAAALGPAVERATGHGVLAEGLVDITLLGDEVDIIRAEKRAFGERGRLLQWPILGLQLKAFQAACAHQAIGDCPDTMQPRNFSQGDVQKLAKSFAEWDPDQLERRVEALHAMLVNGTNSSGQPRVFFFHCNCGCDRTGELAAAYSIRHLHMSLPKALAASERVAGRHMLYPYQVAVQWYCESLRLRGEYVGDDCGDCARTRCADDGRPMDATLQADLRLAGCSAFLAVLACVSCFLCYCGGVEKAPRRRKRDLEEARAVAYKQLPG